MAVLYNLAPSSFKKTTLYLGKTIATGERELMNPVTHKKNSKPAKVMKSTVLIFGLVGFTYSLLIFQYTPPTNSPKIMLCMILALTTIGFLAVFKKSLLMMAPRL